MPPTNPNATTQTIASGGIIAGFCFGLMHGMMTMVTFFVSLFLNDVGFYELNNNGYFYKFGFMLGITILIITSNLSAYLSDS